MYKIVKEGYVSKKWESILGLEFVYIWLNEFDKVIKNVIKNYFFF